MKTIYEQQPRRKRRNGHRKLAFTLAVVFLALGAVFIALEKAGATNVLERAGLTTPRAEIGEVIDSFNGVTVHYNGAISNVSGRSVAPDGYNIGQKYQCVEFVKRYYYEALDHKMPSPWGHAKDFFNNAVPDGEFNAERGLVQFRNGGKSAPQVSDLIVFGGHKFGHVAIVSETGEDYVEIIQQNPGPLEPSRERLTLVAKKKTPVSVTGEAGAAETCWQVGGKRTPLGWLRKQ
ncbi:CHAP domain-containing protein [Desulfovibrio sp. OttesenSCG-928-C06]|nr:CHAP domain-containing protein [Desulfovibrio sp. OttesenSCG-928-C06]